MKKQPLILIVQTAGNKETKMKTILWLIAGLAFSSSSVFSKETKREHYKCYLQLEDESRSVHHFVNTQLESNAFISALNGRSVFMADGVTEKIIVEVYECVDIKENFKNNDALRLEQNTPF